MYNPDDSGKAQRNPGRPCESTRLGDENNGDEYMSGVSRRGSLAGKGVIQCSIVAILDTGKTQLVSGVFVP